MQLAFHVKILRLTALITLALLFISGVSIAQNQPTNGGTEQTSESKLIQLSGIVVTDDGRGLAPVPYVTVYLPEKKRGVYTDEKGFFSLVVEKGDKVRFSFMTLETRNIRVPDTLTQDRYSVVQFMPQDTFTLPETVIFAWPSKEHFKIEFLKMDVTPELQRIAAKNLANDYLAEARKNPNIVPHGGTESANFYLRQQVREYNYMGQTPPMNIFSPIAWAQFFRDWKDGKFKKKN
jgi:CarboxypepD_reg-like domain